MVAGNAFSRQDQVFLGCACQTVAYERGRGAIIGRRSNLRAAALIRTAVISAAVLATLALAGCTAPVKKSDASASPMPSLSPSPSSPANASTPDQIFAGGLYTDPSAHAVAAEARLLAAGDSANAKLINRISSQPTAIWLGEWLTAAKAGPILQKYVAAAKAAGKTLVFVTYAIPHRDCGGLSAGGLTDSSYLVWNQAIATALAGSGAVVLVEPDSLAMLSSAKCSGVTDTRIPLIKKAVDALVAANLTVYLDGGNSHWISPAVMAKELTDAGVGAARGFFTNVSNFYRVDQEREYGDKLAAMLGGKHYVVDVSRNGNGWKGTWCNPTGAALGQPPHASAGTTALDALLWVKHPGDSDGTCNGGPKAGLWWEKYALDLARNDWD
jgi:endoglucanase